MKNILLEEFLEQLTAFSIGKFSRAVRTVMLSLVASRQVQVSFRLCSVRGFALSKGRRRQVTRNRDKDQREYLGVTRKHNVQAGGNKRKEELQKRKNPLSIEPGFGPAYKEAQMVMNPLARRVLDDPKMNDERKGLIEKTFRERSRDITLTGQTLPYREGKRLKRSVSKNMKQKEKEKLREMNDKEELTTDFQKIMGMTERQLIGDELGVKKKGVDPRKLMKRKQSKAFEARKKEEMRVTRDRNIQIEDTFTQPVFNTVLDGDLKHLTMIAGKGTVSRKKLEDNINVIKRQLAARGIFTSLKEDEILREELKRAKDRKEWQEERLSERAAEKLRQQQLRNSDSPKKMMKWDETEEDWFVGDLVDVARSTEREEYRADRYGNVHQVHAPTEDVDADDYDSEDEARRNLILKNKVDYFKKLDELQSKAPQDDDLLQFTGDQVKHEMEKELRNAQKEKAKAEKNAKESPSPGHKMKAKMTPSMEGDVLQVQFITRDEKGNILDKQDAARFRLGDEAVLPKMTQKLLGRLPGERVSFNVKPDERQDAKWDKRLVQKIPRSEIDLENTDGTQDSSEALEVGKYALVFDGKQDSVAKVLEVGEKYYLLDFNHPHANQTLHYEVRVTANFGPSDIQKPQVAEVKGNKYY
jgi:FKBP-type peptidyl-prolyl cis-trans isomerase 2